MSGLCVLWMAALLTEMDAAVEWSTARVSTIEASDPFFQLLFLAGLTRMQRPTLHFFLLRAAEHLRFDLPTVATRFDSDLAGATEAFMARPRASVFATREQITADLPTAPSIVIVRILATLRRRIPPTETILCRTHRRTRQTRTSMASRIARMRTALARSRTCLTTRMWRKSSQRPGIDLLLTPTGIRGWEHLMRQITAGTAPRARRIAVSVRLSTGRVLRCGALVLGPFLHAAQMEHRPA